MALQKDKNRNRIGGGSVYIKDFYGSGVVYYPVGYTEVTEIQHSVATTDSHDETGTLVKQHHGDTLNILKTVLKQTSKDEIDIVDAYINKRLSVLYLVPHTDLTGDHILQYEFTECDIIPGKALKFTTEERDLPLEIHAVDRPDDVWETVVDGSPGFWDRDDITFDDDWSF